VFDGSESEALARIRRISGAAGKSVDQEVALAVATNEPRRLVAAANAYLKKSRQPGIPSQPRTEAALAQAAQTIMKPDSAQKVTAALKQLRDQRTAGAESRAPAPQQQRRDRRPGYRR